MRSYRPSASVSARAVASVCTPHLEVSGTGLGPTSANKDGRNGNSGLRTGVGLGGKSARAQRASASASEAIQPGLNLSGVFGS